MEESSAKPIIVNTAAKMARDELSALLRRLTFPLSVVGVVILSGMGGYRILGGGQWSWLDCFYMTTITMTTVGYGEVLQGMGSSARLFSAALMWVSAGAMVYATAVVTAFIVEEQLGQFFTTRRALKVISRLDNHYILVGAGKSGFHAMNELIDTRRDCVVVEKDKAICERVRKSFPRVPVVEMDVLQEDTLHLAGIERAQGIIVTLTDDGHNLIVVVNARYLNPRIRIAARCSDHSLVDRFQRAGADHVISPNFIGGMRLVSELVRPHVTGFLDGMLRGQGKTRVEEVRVHSGSALGNTLLGESQIREKSGLWPIAVNTGTPKQFIYNPGPDVLLEEGSTLLVITTASQLKKLRQMASGKGSSLKSS